MEFLAWLEGGDFATWVRDSTSIFAYPTILAFHTFSLGLVVGVSAGVALRTLGAAPDLPLGPMERFFRLIGLGFWISAISGMLLLVGDATTFLTNPVFYIKLGAITAALVSVRLLKATVFSDPLSMGTKPVPVRGKILAAIVLTSWLIAVTAGRVTAYDGFIGRQTAGAVLILAVVMLAAGYGAVHFLRRNERARQQARKTASVGF